VNGAVVAVTVRLVCVGDVIEVSVVNTGDVVDVSVNVCEVPEVEDPTSVEVLLGKVDEVTVSLVAEDIVVELAVVKRLVIAGVVVENAVVDVSVVSDVNVG
jgi:hypothetical protein